MPASQPSHNQHEFLNQPIPYSPYHNVPYPQASPSQKMIKPVFQFEDPVSKRKREREERIAREKAEMTALINPFSKLGDPQPQRGRRGSQVT